MCDIRRYTVFQAGTAAQNPFLTVSEKILTAKMCTPKIQVGRINILKKMSRGIGVLRRKTNFGGRTPSSYGASP